MSHKCIDASSLVTLPDGKSKKPIEHLQIGDKIKTLNENGQLEDTEVIMIMDTNQQESILEENIN